MQVYYTVEDLRKSLEGFRTSQQQIGFVPTMGALHKGHLSLIAIAKEQNRAVVASIFVNPTQFNNKEDLAKYPRMPEKDIEMLRGAGCDIVFCPPVDEVYTKDQQPDPYIDLAGLDLMMEGARRPGHFKGVVQVVKRLFEIVEPQNAYFGEKDFQQLLVIRQMVKALDIPVKIIGCPILREFDGLAMSSRNMRLNPEERKSAGLIYKTLLEAKRNSQQVALPELKKWVADVLNHNPLLKVDYVEVADPETLLPVNVLKGHRARIFVAVYAGQVRLIDNSPL
jgi:pantoate--beta-alanine ligase